MKPCPSAWIRGFRQFGAALLVGLVITVVTAIALPTFVPPPRVWRASGDPGQRETLTSWIGMSPGVVVVANGQAPARVIAGFPFPCAEMPRADAATRLAATAPTSAQGHDGGSVVHSWSAIAVNAMLLGLPVVAVLLLLTRGVSAAYPLLLAALGAWATLGVACSAAAFSDQLSSSDRSWVDPIEFERTVRVRVDPAPDGSIGFIGTARHTIASDVLTFGHLIPAPERGCPPLARSRASYGWPARCISFNEHDDWWRCAPTTPSEPVLSLMSGRPSVIGFAANTAAFAGFGAMPLLVLGTLRRVRERDRARRACCRSCGYDVSGPTPPTECPECGRRVAD